MFLSLKLGVIHVGAASSRDDSYKATFFRGWKPLPREIDVNLMTMSLF
jgi:hypothetical protein